MIHFLLFHIFRIYVLDLTFAYTIKYTTSPKHKSDVMLNYIHVKIRVKTVVIKIMCSISTSR